jgi:hypothetical protein
MEIVSDTGSTILKQLESLTDEERIAYLLIQRYCENYDHVFGTPYWPGRRILHSPGDDKDGILPTFVGIATYFRGRRLEIGDRAIPWQGYIRFALESFKQLGQTPCPAQLKNPVLIRKYVEHNHVQPDVPLETIDYSKIVIPELRSPEILRALGLA